MRLAALALALVAGAGAAPQFTPPAAAQDLPAPGAGFAWERVGDMGIDVWDLTFGSDGTLWATGDDGPYRLDLAEGFPGTWELLYDRSFNGAILPLGPDTLLAARGRTERSTDGGQSWDVVHGSGEEGLYEVPASCSYPGRILIGAAESIAYSDDRGATFTDAVVPAPGGNRGGADDFVALPPGAPNEGRILAAGRWGVNVSDDGGATFRESGLWAVLQYVGEGIGLVEGPGGVRAVMAGRVSGEEDARVWVSDDGGETWGPGGGFRLPEGPPEGPSGGVAAVLPLGGRSMAVVLGRGTVYRTDDGGETWVAVGRVPEVNESRYAGSAALGADGRLYVGLSAQGLEDAWVWRTNERVTVATGPAPPPAPEEALRVEAAPNPFRGAATVTLTLARAGTVEAALYDALGRRVAVVASGRLPAGRHAVTLDGSALPQGVYVVRAAAGDAVEARVVTRLR
jgi:photosystem II stability/assembly factor-like uncharacterized protein